MIKYYNLCLYFCFSLFKSPYSCLDIKIKSANKRSVFNWFPIRSCLCRSIIRGCVYCKSTRQRFIYTGVISFILYMATEAKDITLIKEQN